MGFFKWYGTVGTSRSSTDPEMWTKIPKTSQWGECAEVDPLNGPKPKNY